MSEDHKILFLFKSLINLFHIPVHDRTNARAGREKELCHIHFSQYILLSDGITVLINKLKRSYITDYHVFSVGKLRNDLCNHKVKPQDGYQEKCSDDQYLFRFHNYQIFLQRYGKRLPKPSSQKFLQHCCNTSEKAGNFAPCYGQEIKSGYRWDWSIAGMCHSLCHFAAFFEFSSAFWDEYH